jgi:hypothetical protein
MTKFISVLAFTLILSFAIFAINQDKQTDADSQPLKILEQPPAQPSEKVEKDIVEGKVQLRVEFLSTGEIGEVTLYKAKKKVQKSGSVDAAINAAKKIRFEPARKEGKPITVVKILEYRFKVY